MDKEKLNKHIKKHAVDYILFVFSSVGIVITAFWGANFYNAFVRIGVLIVCGLFIISLFIRFLFYVNNKNVEKIADKVIKSLQLSQDAQKVDYLLNNNMLMKEGYPHIAMRIETIQNIFDEVLDKVSDKNILSELGKNVAKNFISQTWDQMNNSTKGETLSPKECILKWLQMERTAGWGLFEISINDINGGKFRGEIKVTNCFLAYRRNEKNKNLCTFLIGYMQEIITSMAGFNVVVNERQCGKVDGKAVCYFSFDPTD